MRGTLSTRPPLSFRAPSRYSLNHSCHSVDLLHKPPMSVYCRTCNHQGREPMDTTPSTKGQRSMKICVVLILGLAVLVGSSTVTRAAQKYKAGRSYCFCFCQTGTDSTGTAIGGVLEWEMTNSCSVVGKKCDSAGKFGKLTTCSECIGSPTGDKVQQCTKQSISGTINPGLFDPGGAPAEQGPKQRFDPAQQAPKGGIYRRGVEGESPATAPTVEEGTTTAPK